MAPPLVWPCHRALRQLTRDRGRAVRRRRRRHLGQLEAAFTLCHFTAGASKSWRASQGQTSSISVTLAVSSAGNVNGTLPKGKRNLFSFSQIEPFRSVQRQRGGGVGVRRQRGVGVRPRRKEGERRPDAPAGQHHPWSPGATWYRSLYYFRNIGNVLFFCQHQRPLCLQYHEQESLHPLSSLPPGGSQLFCDLKPSGREESRCLHSQPSPPLPLGLQHLVKELQEKLVYLHISMPI